jgi:hypothetical protein
MSTIIASEKAKWRLQNELGQVDQKAKAELPTSAWKQTSFW